MTAHHSAYNEVARTPDQQPSLGTLVSDASRHFSTVLHGEIELAKLEVKASVKNAGTGAGMFIGAAVLLAFSLTFGLIALAEGLVALHIWRWAAYLIVFLLLVLLAGLLVFIGIRKVKRVRAPKQTIDTTKDTVAALRQAASNDRPATPVSNNAPVSPSNAPVPTSGASVPTSGASVPTVEAPRAASHRA